MTQEEKRLLLTDLCARLPYIFVYLYTNAPFAEGKPIILTPVVLSNLINATEDLVLKPYLRPMSSMTEEECKELGDLPATFEGIGEVIPNVPYYIEVTRPEQIDWLNAHHFDYRGLINMGLALEAPEDMYKTE